MNNVMKMNNELYINISLDSVKSPWPNLIFAISFKIELKFLVHDIIFRFLSLYYNHFIGIVNTELHFFAAISTSCYTDCCVDRLLVNMECNALLLQHIVGKPEMITMLIKDM